MEVYILDSTFQRTGVVDSFESFIWTERWAAYGDFELVTVSDGESRGLLTIGTRLTIPNSYRVMTIETVINKVDAEGRSILTVSGRSLESVMVDRVAKKTLSDLTVEPKWILTGTPGAIARSIFLTTCVGGGLSASDVIPYIFSGNIFPSDTIAEASDIVTIELEPTTVYDAIKQICDIYSLGFRLVLDPAASKLYFNVYSGSDHTSAQTLRPAVIFSPNFDNLSDTSELTSVEQYKNIAYVFSKNGFNIVYSIGFDTSTAGFERRVLLVKADDIELPAGVALTEALRRRGIDELSRVQSFYGFDGELPQSSVYKYGVAYNLGDVLEMQNSSGVTNYMRVTEQIFVSDSEGDRSYPTLALNIVINPQSWFGWSSNQTWAEATVFWADA